MDKNITCWASCYNQKLFMADMSMTGRVKEAILKKESQNNGIKNLAIIKPKGYTSKDLYYNKTHLKIVKKRKMNFKVTNVFFVWNSYPIHFHQKLNKIAKQNVHFAETTIVPDGIQKDYPMEINFELLESQIVQMKDELLDIVNKKVNSYYQNFSIEICQQVGIRKAGTHLGIFTILHMRILMLIMSYFEILKSLCIDITNFYSLDIMVQKD
ncbi:hypothetical protein C1645_733363 [Glomus cerebriforme]|uniref:Uncharacterized protein n=1 Tax=Glomus cerebriforme TaxID=658196 RepID=A0A397THH7_9GLOM|nr:hypothetical protein C1645_733363 [Glomus cerebriforme]